MIHYIFLLFVIQICHCSAYGEVCVPDYAIYIMGFTITILFVTTVALGVYVYRIKRNRGSDTVFENERHASMIKYERQISSNSQRKVLGNSMDDTVQLKENEYTCDDDNKDDNNMNKTESPPSEPKKIQNRIKVPIFPQMKEEHINALCLAVTKHGNLKECTSLSDLDKIVSDAKAEAKEKSKISEVSASSPDFDVFDETSPKSVKKLPVFIPGPKELKLRDEMVAKFKQGESKTKHSQENKDKIDTNASDTKIKTVDDQTISYLKLDKDDINTKIIQQEIMNNFIQNELKSKLNKSNICFKSQSTEEEIKTENKEMLQDNIYDCPPPPKLQNDVNDFQASGTLDNELYNFPLSPKKHELFNYSLSSKQENELYDFPPSPSKPHKESDDILQSAHSHDDLYDILPPSKTDDEEYDLLPTTKQLSEVYDSVPSIQNRNRVVSDGNTTGYLLALSNPDADLSSEVQYCNAKITAPDKK